MSFELIERLSDDQINDLHQMYQNEWWTEGRELSDVREMLRHSDLIAAFCDPSSRRLAAFARVLTDFVYKALVLDLIVGSSFRSMRLGRTLMNAIIDHSSMQSVRHFELYCLPEMVPFYEKWGFTDNRGDLRLMRLTR